MSSRKNELEGERNALVSFIESIEKDKRQTFLDAFDTVDKEIREIFTKMNGGNAWLELENEDDIFNSGINYFIQFQNKPKRESTSISGGEKTLAAVVLFWHYKNSSLHRFTYLMKLMRTLMGQTLKVYP